MKWIYEYTNIRDWGTVYCYPVMTTEYRGIGGQCTLGTEHTEEITLNTASVVTVIETGTETETTFFLQNRTEPKPPFYASVLAVRF